MFSSKFGIHIISNGGIRQFAYFKFAYQYLTTPLGNLVRWRRGDMHCSFFFYLVPTGCLVVGAGYWVVGVRY